MIYTLKSSTDIAQIAQKIETEAKHYGFGLLHHYGFKEILKTKGFPIEREVTVFELCNPAGAQKVLDAVLAISVYLPCRISLYTEGDKTVLATINFDTIIDGLEIEKDFKQFLYALFSDMKKLMGALK